MRFLAVVGACLPLISGSPVDVSRSDLSARGVAKYELLCGVVGSKPNPIVTKSLKCRLVDCRELCSATSTCESFAKSSTQCLLFSSPVAEDLHDDASSPFVLYDLACPEITSSTVETLPETTTSIIASLTSESGVPVSSDAVSLSEVLATSTTELSVESTSESTSATLSESSSMTVMSSETTTAESTGLDDISSTPVTHTTSVETTSVESQPTTTAEGSTTVISPSIPTFGILRLENLDGSAVGYLSGNDLPLRLSGLKSAALKLQIPALEEGSTSQLDLVHANPGGQDDGLTRLCGIQGFHNQNANFGSASYHLAFLSASVSSPPGSPPSLIDSSFQRRSFTGLDDQRLAVESAIWKIDPDTLEITPIWINTDGSAITSTLFIQEETNWIGITGSLSALRSYFGTGEPFRAIKMVWEPLP